MTRVDPPFWTFAGRGHDRLYLVLGGSRVDPSLEALRPSAALGWLRRLVVDADAQRVLLDVHRLFHGDLATPMWGLGDVASVLADFLGRALERGDLLILEPRSGGAAAGQEEPHFEPISPTPPRVDPVLGTFIEIELLDPANVRFASPLRFTPPSSNASNSRFDGFVRIEGLPRGLCEIEFPEIDGREWGSVPGGPGTGKRTGFDHTVGIGECVSSISRKFGFASWRTVFDDPKNAELRARRPNPNVLELGDVIFVPDPDPHLEQSMTDRRATYRTLALPTRLRIRFEGSRPNDYELLVGGQSHKGSVGPGGMIDVPIPGDASAAELRMWPAGIADQEDRWTISLGELDPVTKLTGVQARLDNLGFSCPVDGVESDETTRAIAAYQRWRGVGDGAGTLDEATRGDLGRFHDG